MDVNAIEVVADESDPTSIVTVIGRLVFFRHDCGFPAQA